MAESNCGILLKSYPKISEFEISFFIVNCVFNSFIRYTATMLNFATIYVQKRLRSRNLSKVIHLDVPCGSICNN